MPGGVGNFPQIGREFDPCKRAIHPLAGRMAFLIHLNPTGKYWMTTNTTIKTGQRFWILGLPVHYIGDIGPHDYFDAWKKVTPDAHNDDSRTHGTNRQFDVQRGRYGAQKHLARPSDAMTTFFHYAQS